MATLRTLTEDRHSLPAGSSPTRERPVVKGVKVLGKTSRNGRNYPDSVMRKALEKYDGVMVNIDHPKGEGPIKYEARFGRLRNPRMGKDGIYADLHYNPKHPLAEGFAWFAAEDPGAVGLSHNAQARTKMREGVEEVEEIVKVDSVDLVAEPASTAGLLESFSRVSKRLEGGSMHGNDNDNGDKIVLKPSVRLEIEKADMPGAIKGPGLFDKERDDMEAEGDYENSPKDQIADVLNDDSLDTDAKINKLLAMMAAATGEQEEPDDEMAEKEGMHMMDDRDMQGEDYPNDDEPGKKKKLAMAEESLRRVAGHPSLRKLLEEVDAYRARDRREYALAQARKACNESSLPGYSITEAFLGILADTNTKAWKSIIEDRRRVIFKGEKPLSAMNHDGRLTVDSLVKSLRS